MQSSIHGGLGTNLRFPLRNSASRCWQRHGGHVMKEGSAASGRRGVQPIQGGLSMWYNWRQSLAASAT